MSLPPAGTALERISEAALEAAELLTQILVQDIGDLGESDLSEDGASESAPPQSSV
jgi:hypothetical protein